MIAQVYNFSETELLLFFMLMMRMTAFAVSWPVFGIENVSAPIKILFAVALTMVIFPTLKFSPEQTVAVKNDLMSLAGREVFIGLSIGYLGRFFFFAFRIAGEMISQALGLGAAQMFNPLMGGQTSSMEQFYVSMATLFYLAVDGHHYLITGLVGTFQTVPLAQLTLNTSQFAGVGVMALEVIELGLKLSAPIVISILTINLVLGVIGKTVPQLNVLVTSFPINILAGLVLMLITLPMLLEQMPDFLELSTTQVFQFVRSF